MIGSVQHYIAQCDHIIRHHHAGVSTVLALVLHFLLKTCSVHLHLPMLLLANLVSVPVEVIATASCMILRPVLLPVCACQSHDDPHKKQGNLSDSAKCLAGGVHLAVHEAWRVYHKGPKARCCTSGY